MNIQAEERKMTPNVSESWIKKLQMQLKKPPTRASSEEKPPETLMGKINLSKSASQNKKILLSSNVNKK